MLPIPDPAGLPPDLSGPRGNRGRGGVVVILALLVLLTGVVAALAFELDGRLALGALRTHHHWLLGFVAGAIPAVQAMRLRIVDALRRG